MSAHGRCCRSDYEYGTAEMSHDEPSIATKYDNLVGRQEHVDVDAGVINVSSSPLLKMAQRVWCKYAFYLVC
jgi:hypothetical protein